MKVITINRENFNWILGRVRKFFFNNNRTEFVVWYSTNCGFKKVPTYDKEIMYIRHNGKYWTYKFNTMHITDPANNVYAINKLNDPKSRNFSDYIMAIKVNFSNIFAMKVTDEYLILEGDTICFKSNKIIIGHKDVRNKYETRYTVFQVYKKGDFVR